MKKQLNFPVPLEMWEGLVTRAQALTREQGRTVSLAFLIRRAIQDSLDMERVLCPECNSVFLAPEGWQCCPVCGVAVGATAEDFIVD